MKKSIVSFGSDLQVVADEVAVTIVDTDIMRIDCVNPQLYVEDDDIFQSRYSVPKYGELGLIIENNKIKFLGQPRKSVSYTVKKSEFKSVTTSVFDDELVKDLDARTVYGSGPYSALRTRELAIEFAELTLEDAKIECDEHAQKLAEEAEKAAEKAAEEAANTKNNEPDKLDFALSYEPQPWWMFWRK